MKANSPVSVATYKTTHSVTAQKTTIPTLTAVQISGTLGWADWGQCNKLSDLITAAEWFWQLWEERVAYVGNFLDQSRSWQAYSRSDSLL
jgi:hypothetical protein